MIDQRPPSQFIEPPPTVAAEKLICARCGGSITVEQWQPLIRCPHCETLGYPDRSYRNLLSLGWECLECGAHNDPTVNFCLTCGAGLATRCLRCEQPVYTAICGYCGAHQGQIAHFHRTEAHRATWVPVLRDRARLQRVAEEPPAPTDPTYGVARWQQIDLQMREATEARRKRFDRKRAARKRNRGQVWGWIWIIAGVAFLLSSNWEHVTAFLGQAITLPTISSLLGQVQAWITASRAWQWLTTWWEAFSVSLNNPPAMNEQAYAILFMTGLFALALLPVSLFFIGRLVRRLFP